MASFEMTVRDPYLEMLLQVVAEPNATVLAHLACDTTRYWWDDHGTGPTCDELLGAVFTPEDWSVTGDITRTRLHCDKQTALLQEWIIQHLTRMGAISFIPDIDTIIRPGISLNLAINT